jgi:predicted transposase/invertase (TIGR01784 family)
MLKLAAWEDGKEEGRAAGRQEGLTAGREEGREETLRRTAKNGKAMGLPVEQIAVLTGLDPEEIRSL